MSEYLVTLNLVANSKAVRYKPIVFKVTDNGLEPMKATIPLFRDGVLVAGKYLVKDGDVLLYRADFSSHRNSRQKYELVKIVNGELKTLAWIEYTNNSPSFSDDKLEMIFAKTLKPIEALVEYYKMLNTNK